MEELNLSKLIGQTANFYYPVSGEYKPPVKSDWMFFKLGRNIIGVVARSTSRSWDYRSAGVFYNARGYVSDEALSYIEWSKPIKVKIADDGDYISTEKGGSHALLTLYDADVLEDKAEFKVVAEVRKIIPMSEFSQEYCSFEVSEDYFNSLDLNSLMD